MEEWHTPSEYREAAARVMGVLDLDLSSTAELRNKRNQTWRGNVFVTAHGRKTVPHLEIVEKLILGLASGEIRAAVFLCHGSTDAAWWQAAAKRSRAICFLRKRICFLRDTGTGPVATNAPTNGQMALYFGDEPRRFREVFGKMGSIGVKHVATYGVYS